jgi:flavodoxin I
MFVGLPIDEDNEYDMTPERLEKWVEKLKKEFI